MEERESGLLVEQLCTAKEPERERRRLRALWEEAALETEGAQLQAAEERKRERAHLRALFDETDPERQRVLALREKLERWEEGRRSLK